MMPRYDSTRDVTPKYIRRMLNVLPVYAVTRRLKKDTKRYQEEVQNDDEIGRTSRPTSDPPFCSVLILRLACICLIIVRI